MIMDTLKLNFQYQYQKQKGFYSVLSGEIIIQVSELRMHGVVALESNVVTAISDSVTKCDWYVKKRYCRER